MDKTSLILGIILGGAAMYLIIHLLWRVGYYFLRGVVSFARSGEQIPDRKPRSLGKMENALLPQVLQDSPALCLEQTKQQVRDFIENRFKSREGFQIHQIVLSNYRKDLHRKVLVFSSSVCWKEKRITEKRLQITMEAPRESQDSSWQITDLKER